MYSTNLTRMIDNIFALPTYTSFFYDDRVNRYHEQVMNHDNGATKITVLVPGLAKEDFTLQAKQDGTLVLQTKQEVKDKLTKTWHLSDDADVKAITAECKNGLFTITVPVKTNKPDKTRTIEIV